MSRSPLRSPAVVAVLSFLLPGLGQAASGRRRRGLLVAIPPVVLFVVLAAILVGSRRGVIALAFDSSIIEAILVLDALALCYHVWAIFDAYRLASSVAAPLRSTRVRAFGQVVLLAAIVGSVAVHGTIGQIDQSWRDFVTAGFGDMPSWLDATPPPGASDLPPDVTEATPTPVPTPSPSETAGETTPPPAPTSSPTPTAGLTPLPSPTPKPTPKTNWATSGRLDLLVIGTDAGPDRWMLRTDTMILVSVDITTGRTSMFGIPRNLTNVPLPAETADVFPCHCFPQMLNALYVYAMQHPTQFPGGQTRGFRALEGAVSELTGVHVDGSVVVNLAGFVKLVNALGGLEINVPARLVDANYPLEDGTGYIALDIKPGWQHLNGRMALAYARSRHQDSDYGRMRRQQEVLLALRAQLKPCRLVTQIQPILNAVKGTFWTDLPMSNAPDLLALAQHVNPAYVGTYAFGPPNYPQHLDEASIARIRYSVAHAWDGLKAPGGGGGWNPFEC